MDLYGKTGDSAIATPFAPPPPSPVCFSLFSLCIRAKIYYLLNKQSQGEWFEQDTLTFPHRWDSEGLCTAHEQKQTSRTEERERKKQIHTIFFLCCVCSFCLAHSAALRTPSTTFGKTKKKQQQQQSENKMGKEGKNQKANVTKKNIKK